MEKLTSPLIGAAFIVSVIGLAVYLHNGQAEALAKREANKAKVLEAIKGGASKNKAIQAASGVSGYRHVSGLCNELAREGKITKRQAPNTARWWQASNAHTAYEVAR